jgi:DNA-binding MarR family transcriptional regulator
VVDSHPQLRSVFSLTLALEPLKPAELLRLLERRYTALAADPHKPARAPVATRAVQALYALFHGDLRGTLAALDEAAHGLLGYGKRPDAALVLTDIQPFLRRRYEGDARARLTGAQADALEALARRMKGKSFSVKDAAEIWGNERSRAARVLMELQKAGYILLLEERATGDERGRPAALYTLTGATLLAFSGD